MRVWVKYLHKHCYRLLNTELINNRRGKHFEKMFPLNQSDGSSGPWLPAVTVGVRVEM